MDGRGSFSFFFLLFSSTHHHHKKKLPSNQQHIALAVNEELDLQSRLLDDFGDDLDATAGRLAAARRRLSLVAAQAGECRTTLTALAVMLALSALAVVLIRLARLL
jgi:syntaxin of plants SYP5